MANKNNWGGRRPGAGRKARRDEEEFNRLVSEAVPYDLRVKILRKLAERAADGDIRAANLALAYACGRPGFVTLEDDNAPKVDLADAEIKYERDFQTAYPNTELPEEDKNYIPSPAYLEALGEPPISTTRGTGTVDIVRENVALARTEASGSK